MSATPGARPCGAGHLSLLRIPTFRAGVVGGSLFRIGVGALPFALPLMLQLTSPVPLRLRHAHLRLIRRCLVMKTTARPILRRFGFWRVLVVNALISSAFIGANALFTPETPHAAIVACC